jgi:hypothetical protein
MPVRHPVGRRLGIAAPALPLLDGEFTVSEQSSPPRLRRLIFGQGNRSATNYSAFTSLSAL